MDSHVKSIQWGKGIVKQLEIYQTLGSTNEFAKTRIKSGGSSGTVLWALNQTQGKGRRGRRWDADHSSLTFSLIWRAKEKAPNALTLFVGLGIAQQLENLVPDLKLKWPNDLWLGKKKLGGILTETISHEKKLWVIVGVGLNVNSAPNYKASPRVSLQEATNCFWSRFAILDQALLGVELGFELARQKDNDLSSLFRRYGNFFDRPITIYHGRDIFVASALDVLSDGRLLIKDARGERALLPNEISIRFD